MKDPFIAVFTLMALSLIVGVASAIYLMPIFFMHRLVLP